MNVPARRVIISGVQRGLEDVSSIDIKQMVGRAGRYGIDDRGDAYILIPESKDHLYDKYIDNIPPIKSCLLDKTELSFHIINEIYNGINTKELLEGWYRMTLAYMQTGSYSTLIETLEELVSNRIILYKNGRYKTTPLAKIAAILYYSPYFVSNLCDNLMRLSSDPTDSEWAWAIGNAMEDVYCSNEVDWIIDSYLKDIYIPYQTMYPKRANVAAVHMLLNGVHDKYPLLISLIRAIQYDAERLSTLIEMLSRYYMGPLPEHTKIIGIRLKYGVPGFLVDLIRVKGIGKVYAKKLYEKGIRTPEDIIEKSSVVMALLGKTIASKIIENTKKYTLERV